jgi:hypothetical protein
MSGPVFSEFVFYFTRNLKLDTKSQSWNVRLRKSLHGKGFQTLSEGREVLSSVVYFPSSRMSHSRTTFSEGELYHINFFPTQTLALKYMAKPEVKVLIGQKRNSALP